MSQATSIEWTDATWNPLRGCSRVSEGCRNCYAEKVAYRFSGPGQAYDGLVRIASDGERRPQWNGTTRLVESHLLDPLRWREPRRIFVNSMSDLFHESVPDEWIDRIFAVMALCPQHTFQVLTKRPERMLAWFSRPDRGQMSKAITNPCAWHVWSAVAPLQHQIRRFTMNPFHWAEFADTDPVEPWPLPNVWLGVSVEDQAAADSRIPLLLQTPAAVRFISAEPLLGPVTINAHRFPLLWNSKLDWIIVGGESGPGARPMHPDWARSLRDQCGAAGVPFFFKQWGEWLPAMQDGGNMDGEQVLNASDAAVRVGKKRAGHLLDGQEWHQFPQVSAPR